MKHYNNDPNLRGLRRLDAIIGNNCKGPSFPMEDGRWLLAERKREKQTCETSLKASALKCHTINSVDTPLAKTSHSAEHNISGTGEVNFREYGCPAFPVWPLVVLCSLLDLSRGRHQCKIGARWQVVDDAGGFPEACHSKRHGGNSLRKGLELRMGKTRTGFKSSGILSPHPTPLSLLLKILSGQLDPVRCKKHVSFLRTRTWSLLLMWYLQHLPVKEYLLEKKGCKYEGP
ncbi:uncharacterized protein LOC144318164 isoform X3 [Canis aureus]